MTALCSEVAVLRAQVRLWRAAGERVALVPTMGALHAGHLALVAAACELADRVIVTVFVNPTQFAPSEDFAAYPRDLERDRAHVGDAGAALVFAPDVATMYPAGFATSIQVGGPAIVGLEDRFRPTHFAGVATIVAKLLLQAQADVALFGEKDFQQLRVIERLVSDLDIPVAIRAVPTLRDADGLALSSRNAYLDAAERARAPELFRALTESATAIANGSAVEAAMAQAERRLAAAGFVVDYAEARHAESLEPLEGASSGPIRLLAAARLGRTRLIDNVGVDLPHPLPSARKPTG